MSRFCRPRGGPGALQALVLFSFATLSLAQYAYNDDLNYYDDYQLYNAGYHYDMYDESEDGPYYNQYTGDYDDVYGDYFFEDTEENEMDCRIGADSTPVFNGKSASSGFSSWCLRPEATRAFVHHTSDASEELRAYSMQFCCPY